MLQHERPLARAGRCRKAGFMTETTGKICLPCCCAWMPMRWPLTWRPGRWRARRAGPAGWPRGDTAGNGRSGCAAGAPRGCGRGGRAAGPAAGPAPAAVLVRAAPRGRHRGHRRRGGPGAASASTPGTASEVAGSPLGDALNAVAAAVDCARLAMAGHGHRPVAAALGVPAGTVRGWLRRLRARAGQLRAHAIGELRRAPSCAGPGSRRTSQRPWSAQCKPRWPCTGGTWRRRAGNWSPLSAGGLT